MKAMSVATVIGLVAQPGSAASTSRAAQTRSNGRDGSGWDDFTVTIDGEAIEGWQEVTIPGKSIEQDEYREGNDAEYEKKTWGQPSFDDLEMERGVKPGDTKLHDWFEDVRAGRADEGRREISIRVMDQRGTPRDGWDFTGAWIKAYDPPELDASADGDMATESVTIAFDEMIRTEA